MQCLPDGAGPDDDRMFFVGNYPPIREVVSPTSIAAKRSTRKVGCDDEAERSDCRTTDGGQLEQDHAPL